MGNEPQVTTHALSFGAGPVGTYVPRDGWKAHDNGAPGAGFVIADGALTNTADGPIKAASYLLREHLEPVTELSARFVLHPGSSRLRLRDNGGVMLGAWGGDITANWPHLPDSPCHLVVTATHWTYGVWVAGVGLSRIARGMFPRRLRRDGRTIHSLSVRLAGPTATVRFPGGGTRTLRDPRIAAMPGGQACFELYQQNALKDSRPAFVEVAAT